MKWILLLSLAMCNVPIHSQTNSSQTRSANVPEAVPPLMHVSTSFSFSVNAPMREAAPLFGPEGERAWAGDEWNPQFLFPTPARDVEGAVFTIQHGEHKAVWVNTIFDLDGGRMQYVYVLGNLLATTIDVHLHPIDAQHTKVDVTYTRTALVAEANEHVAAMSKHDSKQGPEWERSINQYLEQHNTGPSRP
jgi:hypothetical protein